MVASLTALMALALLPQLTSVARRSPFARQVRHLRRTSVVSLQLRQLLTTFLVFPGDEGMYIKTIVDKSATLAVPDPDYWQSTGAQYVQRSLDSGLLLTGL